MKLLIAVKKQIFKSLILELIEKELRFDLQSYEHFFTIYDVVSISYPPDSDLLIIRIEITNYVKHIEIHKENIDHFVFPSFS